jgi:hypothetical protein
MNLFINGFIHKLRQNHFFDEPGKWGRVATPFFVVRHYERMQKRGFHRIHLKLIDERMKSLKNDLEYKNMKEGDLRDKAIKELDQKMFPWAIEKVKKDYQEIYENEWEEYGSGSSGQRYNHGFYGHLFALLNNEKKVPTYLFTYNNHNQFIFNQEEKSLHLYFLHLVGNFQIDWKESERILKDVTEIRDEFKL